MADLKIKHGVLILKITSEYASKLFDSGDVLLTTSELESNGIFFGEESIPRFKLIRVMSEEQFCFIPTSAVNMITTSVIELMIKAKEYIKEEAKKNTKYGDLSVNWNSRTITKRGNDFGTIASSNGEYVIDINQDYARRNYIWSKDLESLTKIVKDASRFIN